MRKRILALALLAAGALAATALATPIIGMVTAETARGELDDRLQVNTRFDNGARVKLNTKGPIEIIMQRSSSHRAARSGGTPIPVRTSTSSRRAR